MGRTLAILLGLTLNAQAQQLLSGNTSGSAPVASVGAEASWFLDNSSGKVFGPKSFGTWPASPASTPTTWLGVLSGAQSVTGTWTFASGVTITTGGLTASAGNIAASAGAVSAGTTVTGGTGVTATTGNVTATAGNVIAGVALRASAALPTISSCGTSPPAATAGSSNNAGQFTLGTGTPTACTVTFATAFPTSAFCTVTPASLGGAAIVGGYYISAQSASAFTLTIAVGTDSLVFNYTCVGN